MLINLRTIHRPASLDEAATHLAGPTCFPIYGGGASLIRADYRDIEQAVDLTGVIGNQCSLQDALCHIDSGATLFTIASSDEQLKSVINVEMPETLQHGLTLGDVLMEANPRSLLLALLLGLEARIVCHGGEALTIDQWFDMTRQQRQFKIIQRITFSYYAAAPIRVAVEKVSRTRADAPIVGAVGLASGGYRASTRINFFCVIVGLANKPVIYLPRDLPKLQSQISDYLGSAEYRANVARVAGQRVILAAVQRASQGHF